MMARYPKEPTLEEQEALRSFVFLFARLYPWYTNPELFPEDIHPPKSS